MVEVCTF